VSPLATQLDFGPALQAVLDRLADEPVNATAWPTLIARNPVIDFAGIDAEISQFADVYHPRPGAIGSFKVIGRAKLAGDRAIHTTSQAWEFQGWLPFASKRIVQLAGAFAELDLTVLAGEIHVSLLAEDGEKLVGDRYPAQVGSHRIELPIPSNEVKGIVFSTGETRGEPSRFKINHARVLELNLEADEATTWREAVAASTTTAPQEKQRWTEIEVTAALAVYRLMAQNQAHRARMLLHAAGQSAGGATDWFPPRLAEQLEDFLGYSEGISVLPAATTELAPAFDQSPPQAWRETLALRRVFDNMAFCPVHREIMELALFLDLKAATGGWPLSMTWNREALATTPVARGILRQLFEVITNRVGTGSRGLEVTIHTRVEGTSIRVVSDLRNGDLQYREFSADVAELQRALNSELTALPHLVHNLGREQELEIRWPDQLPAAPAEILRWSHTPEDPSIALHESERGGRTWLRGGLCYKTAPLNFAKTNDLEQEAKIVRDLPELEFLPQIGAALAGPTGSAMSYAFEPGQTLAEWNETQPDEAQIIWVIQSLSDAVSRLNQRRVQHRDLRAENVFVRPDLSVHLIDFDQAEYSAAADDFGNEWDEARACAGFGGLIRQLRWESVFLRTAGSLACAWELGRQSAANSPGKHACYYRWQWGPLALTGERPWVQRWQLCRDVFARPPGTFLEFGCNLGLLSTYASQIGWTARGLDQDEVAVAAAEQIAATLGASARFGTADITDPTTFDALDETYDMVSALSVVHWLSDSQPIENFLRRQRCLLFEGHRSFAEERDYLQSLDFPKVQLLGYSERLRPVLIATQ
jgi:hypothetical protein